MSAALTPTNGGVRLPDNRLDRLARGRRPLLIAYLPLGDPAAPRGLADLYVKSGVDVLEVGVPVPNPYLDGETIRSSMERMRRANIGLREISSRSARLRSRHPTQAIVWMTYGPTVPPGDLVRLASRARIDGVLFVEPARHFAQLARELAGVGIHLLHFLPRDMANPDVEAARQSGGYVMLQATGGRTGSGDSRRRLPDSTRLIRRLRQAHVNTPIALGVGIRSPAQARQAVEMGADAVIVGTEVVRQALRGRRAVAEYLAELRRAVS